MIVTSNLVFSQWDKIFKDPMTTLAAIDRVVHHAVILDLMALESYRAKEATHQQARHAPRTAQASTPQLPRLAVPWQPLEIFSADEIESDLSAGWDEARGESRLNWDRARHPVRDAWQRISDAVERAIPGDSDKDGK